MNLFSLENDRKGDTYLIVVSESFHSFSLLTEPVELKKGLGLVLEGWYSYESMEVNNKIIYVLDDCKNMQIPSLYFILHQHMINSW